MNQQVFDMIKEYEEEINKVFSRLEERGINYEEAASIVGDLDFLHDKFLGLDWEKISQRMDEVEPTFITKDYEDIPKYLKLYIIYDCEDDMALCLSTAETVYLVPKELLDDSNVERLNS